MMDARAAQDETGRKQVSNLQLEQDDLVIFGEDGEFHYVQKAQYMKPDQRLPEKYRSAPEFLVGLGAVVADITVFKSVQVNGSKQVQEQKPEPLTGRCSCILLNIAAIRQESVKRAGSHATGKSGRSTELPPVPSGHDGGPEPKTDDLVIFGEDGEFYLVDKGVYKDQVLPEGMESAPLLMVELGVVIADIPRLPTAGSACHLVNLASIRKGSEETARDIRHHKERTLRMKLAGTQDEPAPARPSRPHASPQARRGGTSGGSRRRTASRPRRGNAR
jgi:hypothetical protein